MAIPLNPPQGMAARRGSRACSVDPFSVKYNLLFDFVCKTKKETKVSLILITLL